MLCEEVASIALLAGARSPTVSEQETTRTASCGGKEENPCFKVIREQRYRCKGEAVTTYELLAALTVNSSNAATITFQKSVAACSHLLLLSNGGLPPSGHSTDLPYSFGSPSFTCKRKKPSVAPALSGVQQIGRHLATSRAARFACFLRLTADREPIPSRRDWTTLSDPS